MQIWWKSFSTKYHQLFCKNILFEFYFHILIESELRNTVDSIEVAIPKLY